MDIDSSAIEKSCGWNVVVKPVSRQRVSNRPLWEKPYAGGFDRLSHRLWWQSLFLKINVF